MLESLPFVLILSIALGFLSGLGVGGGSLLILWLTLVLNFEQNIARSINLLFFIPCAIITTLFRWRQGSLDIKSTIPAIIFGCISAGIFSILSKIVDIAILKKIFGVLLLCIGLKEITYKIKKAEQ